MTGILFDASCAVAKPAVASNRSKAIRACCMHSLPTANPQARQTPTVHDDAHQDTRSRVWGSGHLLHRNPCTGARAGVGQESACRRGCLRGRSPSESRPNRCSAANRECVPQPDSCSAAAVYSITAATGWISLSLTATPLQVAKDGPTVRLFSRSGYNLSKLIPCRSVVLDAELYL